METQVTPSSGTFQANQPPQEVRVRRRAWGRCWVEGAAAREAPGTWWNWPSEVVEGRSPAGSGTVPGWRPLRLGAW